MSTIYLEGVEGFQTVKQFVYCAKNRVKLDMVSRHKSSE